MTTRRWLMVALAAAAVLLIAGRELAGVYADYLWYDSLSAKELWATRLAAELTLRVGSMLIAGLFAFANLYAVRKSVVSLVLPRRLGNLEIGEEVPGRFLIGTAVGLSVILGVLLAMPEQDWTTYLLARWGYPFNEVEPYFQRDLGFFVYRLPFENAVWTWAFFTVLVVTIAVIALYALTPSLKWQRGTIYASAYVRRHFTVLVGILLLMLAWSFRLDMYSLVLDGSGPEGAFGYVDLHVGTLGDLVLALITLAAALVVIWAGFVGQLRLAGVSVLTVIALSLVIREVAPVIAQHTGTDVERGARERPFLGTRAGYTRRAFNVDFVLPLDSALTFPSLTAALPWIPAWDPPALARAIDGGRVTDAASVKIGWQISPAIGLLADVVDPAAPAAAARAPWTLARVVAATADDRGAPMRVAGPAATAIDDTPLEAPIVYPGAPSYTIIADSLNHGTGTSLEPLLARIANAWALQNFSIAWGDLQQPHPSIVLHRDVRDRIALLAPFFVPGRQVQPLLVGDSLYWGVDLYAASSTYPLSRRARLLGEDRSYLQHAAVAIVQASTGDVTLVPDSLLDPIAKTWIGRLQSIFGNWSALPPGIQSLLAPPIDGLTAQALAYARYGSHTDSDMPRFIPKVDGADTSLITDPLPMVLPGSRITAVTLPLVDDRDALRGVLVGTGGTARRTYWYPLRTAGRRWTSILELLRSADSAGNSVREGPLVAGRVRAVPVTSGIAFMQPRYRWRPQSIPALNRIALLSGDTARSIAPLSNTAHLNEMTLPSGDFRAAVNAAYAQMRDAMRRGDWVAFGRAFDALGRALARGGTP
jgi:uncharacterized membrane protein (UPF0182 family)